MLQQPLSALRPGDRATVGRVDGGGPVRRRLLEMGLTPGTPVTVVRWAPLLDPVEIQVRGYELCVRRSEADAVWVSCERSEAQPTPPRWLTAMANLASFVTRSVVTVAAAVGFARFVRLG